MENLLKASGKSFRARLRSSFGLEKGESKIDDDIESGHIERF